MQRELKNAIEKFVEEVHKKYKIKFAYVFGSTARGEDNKNSDIDLAFYFEKEYTELDEAFIRGNIIEDGKASLKREVDVVSLDRATLLLRYEVVKEGIVIKDHIDRASFESLVFREYFDFKYYADIYNEAILESIKNDTYFRRNDDGKAGNGDLKDR